MLPIVVTRPLTVLIVALLSAPAWISWPFLSERRQRIVIDVIKALADWSHGPGPRQ